MKQQKFRVFKRRLLFKKINKLEKFLLVSFAEIIFYYKLFLMTRTHSVPIELIFCT